MDKLNFFTPVVNYPFSPLSKAAEEYFSYGSQQAEVTNIRSENGKVSRFDVKLSDDKQSPLWLTALKVLSLFTIVVPLFMLIVKAINRATPVVVTSLKRPDCGPVLDKDKIQKKFEAVYKKAGIEPKEATAIQRHAVYFADPNTGNVTEATIREGFNKLHMGKLKSAILAKFVFKGFAGTVGGSKTEVSLRDIAKGKHPSDTGIFDKDGNYVEKNFKAIQQFAKTDESFLTGEEVSTMIKANKARDIKLSRSGFGALASSGEFSLALTLFSDCATLDKNGHYVRGLSFDRLRQMYLEGPYLFEQAAAKN